jgi:hypothetical protein
VTGCVRANSLFNFGAGGIDPSFVRKTRDRLDDRKSGQKTARPVARIRLLKLDAALKFWFGL